MTLHEFLDSCGIVKWSNMAKANQLQQHKRKIISYLRRGLNYNAIMLLINPSLEHEMTYHGFRAWILKNIKNDKNVSQAKQLENNGDGQ